LAPAARRRTVLAACLGWLFSAVDIVLLVLFQRPVAQALGVDVQVIRVAIGVGLLGSAVGGIALAQIGDRYGRVRARPVAAVARSVGAWSCIRSPPLQRVSRAVRRS
jgi:MFS family permease